MKPGSAANTADGDTTNEIRVVYRLDSRINASGIPVGGSHWHPDSPSNRQMLNVILESVKEILGPGEYWIETRGLCPPSDTAPA